MDRLVILGISGLLGIISSGIYVGIKITKFRQSLALMATNLEVAENKLNEFISQIDREELQKTKPGQELLSLLAPLEKHSLPDKQLSPDQNRLDNIIITAIHDSMAKSDKVDVSVDLKDTPPNVENPDEFKNIINRLLENSIKMMDKSNVEYRPRIRISGRISENSYILTVEDFGPGIPKDVADILFKSFSDKSSDLAEQLFNESVLNQHNKTITVRATSNVSKQLNRVVIELPAQYK